MNNNTTVTTSSIGEILTAKTVIKTLEGFLILVGNILLMVIILSQKKLRRKEFLTLAGLAFGDAIFGESR